MSNDSNAANAAKASDGRYCIADFGADPTGAADSTAAVRGAIEACAAAGGGTVVVPAGRFLTGPVTFVSNLNLHLEPGGTLLFSTRFEDYPPVATRWEGVECYGYHPLVYGRGLYNVSISGRGVLDGRGEPWWNERRRRAREGIRDLLTAIDKRLAQLNPGYASAGGGGGGRESQFLRPPLVQFMDCENVVIDGVTCRNSPFWNTHLVYCRNVHVRDVTFYNPNEASNGDGIDIDSCKGVSLTGCSFDMGDDCIVIKSGCDADGRRVNRPCEDISISNCLLLRGHGGVVFGSEGAAGIRNVTVTNCIFRGTDRGVRFKSRRGRGGTTEDIRISNLVMTDVRCPLVMNLYYVCGVLPEEREHAFSADAQAVDETTPVMRNVHLSDITSRRTRACAAVLLGLPESPLSGVTLDNVVISLDPDTEPCNPAMAHGIEAMRRAGVIGRNVRGLSLRNVSIVGTEGPVVSLENADGVTVCNLEAEPTDHPVLLRLRGSRKVRLSNCPLPEGASSLVDTGESDEPLIA